MEHNMDNIHTFFKQVDGPGEQSFFQVTKGPFKGLKYFYENVKFAEDENSDGTLDCSFTWTAMEFAKIHLDDPRIEELLGDILIVTLADALEGKEGEILRGENRDDDTEKSTT